MLMMNGGDGRWILVGVLVSLAAGEAAEVRASARHCVAGQDLCAEWPQQPEHLAHFATSSS
jgi:hypothetical protein